MAKQINFKELTEDFRKRSAAASKGWKTRRAREREAMTPQQRRSAAAKKGWQTRKKNSPEYQRRSAAARKGWETRRRRKTGDEGGPNRVDTCLKNLYSMIDNWTPQTTWSEKMKEAKQHDKDTLASIINGAIQEVGYWETARRLEENAEDALSSANVVLYDSDDDHVDHAMNRVVEIIRGRALTAAEAKNLEDATDRAQNIQTTPEEDDLLDFMESQVIKL